MRALLNLTPQEWAINDAAAKLARNLVMRMDHRALRRTLRSPRTLCRSMIQT